METFISISRIVYYYYSLFLKNSSNNRVGGKVEKTKNPLYLKDYEEKNKFFLFIIW